MLSDDNLFKVIAINVVIFLFWNLIVCCACKMLGNEYFDYKKYMYKIKYWEDKGNLYNKWLKIKAWKDRLPQYISKNGFSKKNFNSLSLEYIDRFILETCRAEWAHRNCILIVFLMILINKFVTGLIFSLIVMFIHFPYICIQRYNRIRLIKIREKILKSKKDNYEKEKIIKFVKKFKLS